MNNPLKVMVVGATGVIGRPLVSRLKERGHDVLAASRSGRSPVSGVEARAVDLTFAPQVHALVGEFRPDVIVSEVTSLPAELNPRRLSEIYQANNRVRRLGTTTLLAAAKANGVRRFVSQSAAYWYAPAGTLVKSEEAPFYKDAPEPIGTAVRVMEEVERAVRTAPGIEGVNLRYGHFYGPGTWYAPDGAIGKMMRKRAYPIISGGDGLYSFIHVDDAADATVAAIESSAVGDFNIADDDPATAADWMPELAEALGAAKPFRVSAWLARLLIGNALVDFTLNQRAASNERARAEFGWRPRYSSWREGFRTLRASSE